MRSISSLTTSSTTTNKLYVVWCLAVGLLYQSSLIDASFSSSAIAPTTASSLDRSAIVSRVLQETIAGDLDNVPVTLPVNQEEDMLINAYHEEDYRSLQQQMGGFFNAQFCYDALFFADEDKDRRITGNEYVNFLKIMAMSDFLPEVTVFTELPLILRSNFIILACLCLERGDDQCCVGDNANISNEGAFPDETPTEQQASYLYLVCFLTTTSVDRVIASRTPTMGPALPSPPPTTTAPTTTSPTSSPSSSPPVPTTSPTTTAPTDAAPVAVPSGTPTQLNPSNAPTGKPTTSPTFPPSSAPTSESSSAPTIPTLSPSSVDRVMPSNSPSMSPTPETTTQNITSTVSPSTSVTSSSAPTSTVAPTTTSAPTQSPTMTHRPTLTVAPSSTPRPSVVTESPTGTTVSEVPSDSPSVLPSSLPTLAPTVAATIPTEPTEILLDEVTKITYRIAVKEGLVTGVSTEAYEDDLVGSMDVLAVQVAEELFGSPTGRQLRKSLEQDELERTLLQLRRRLSVTVAVPTTISGVIETDCPMFVNDDDRCEDVTATIGFLVSEDEDLDQVMVSYKNALDSAVENQRLQEILTDMFPDSLVFILTGLEEAESTLPPDASTRDSGGETVTPERFSAGAIFGFVVGALLFVFIAIMLLLRGGRSQDQYRKQEGEEFAEIVPGQLSLQQQPAQIEEEHDILASTDSTAFDYDYRKRDQPVPTKKDDSSGAGSSGWSSHGGMSSLDTGSADEENIYYAGAAGGTTLVDIGAASSWARGQGPSAPAGTTTGASLGSARSGQKSAGSIGRASTGGGASTGVGSIDTDSDLATSYSELDRAIQEGDWAAVGVTAALLASQSFDSQSVTSGYSSVKTPLRSTIDPKRAAELDQLVEAGDWEGVVRAAARYETQSASGSTLSRADQTGSASSSVEDGIRDVGSPATTAGGSGTEGGDTSTFISQEGSTSAHTSTAMSTAGSSTVSKSKNREHIRNEVEALVRRVVPEEIDNIDEMMTQFSGREEELVETLRTMQERAVAQKARLAGQKQAKRAVQQEQLKSGQRSPSRRQQVLQGLQSGTASQSMPATPGEGTESDVTSPPGAQLRSDGDWIHGGQGGPSGGSKLDTPSVREQDEEDEDSEDVPTPSNSTPGHVAVSSVAAGGGTGRLGAGKLVSPGEEGIEDLENELQAAIEAGDWDRVAHAAQALREAKGDTGTLGWSSAARSYDSSGGGTRQITRGVAGSGSTSPSIPPTVMTTEGRTQELSRMISRGDWEGIVEASNRYSAADQSVDTTESQRRARRLKRLKEEEEALKEADIWNAIAEQTKNEKASEQDTAGARDAADWAIARSLSALVRATDDTELEQQLRSKEPLETQIEGNEGEEDDEDEV